MWEGGGEAAMISVRKGRSEDIRVLLDFNMRLARETENLELDEDILEKGLTAVLADSAKGQFFVAVDNDEGSGGEIVGCLSITTEWSDWRNGMVWWLQNVYVKESHRKKGVFRLLFNFIAKLIHDDPSVIGLRLLTNVSNSRAHKAYTTMGMSTDHFKVYEIMK